MNQISRKPIELKDVLVVTTKKGFWASEHRNAFPHIVFTRIFFGRSGNWLNAVPLYLISLFQIAYRRPKVILVGPTGKAGLMLALTKKVFRLRYKIIFTQPGSQSYVANQVSRCIVYDRETLARSTDSVKKVFCQVPLHGNFKRNTVPNDSPQYIFSGGGTLRDFPTLIRAVSGLPIQLVIVTHRKSNLEFNEPLPDNCTIHYNIPLDQFHGHIAKSLFVVIPLKDTPLSHGITVIIESMALGKCVITNNVPSARDYIDNEKDGVLIAPGDVRILRSQILEILHDEAKREKVGKAAKERSKSRSPERYCKFITELCGEVSLEP